LHEPWSKHVAASVCRTASPLTLTPVVSSVDAISDQRDDLTATIELAP
jgi:hypothetical protein